MRANRELLRAYRQGLWFALLVSLVIISVHFALPDQRLQVGSGSEHEYTLYGYADAQTGSSGTWVNQQDQHWRCNYKEHHVFGCGWDTRLFLDRIKGTDLQDYEAIELKLQYQGPAKRIRVFIRNFNDAYSTVGNIGSSKVMSTTFPVEEAQGPVIIEFNEFAVADWWLAERRARQQWPLPEFSGVINIGVDFIDKGDHEIRIESLALIKPWIKTETLLLWLLGFWMGIFIIEGLARFSWLYYHVARERRRVRNMEFKQQQLQVENAHLKNLADTDPLTGILNRSGLQSRLDDLKDSPPSGWGLLLLDLDHFKKLNDQYGHDMGDRALKAFSSLLAMNLRGSDIFARMGGEEFVIICERQPLENLLAFAEKLRGLVTKCEFDSEPPTHLSTSIGICTFKTADEFEKALELADKALYRAKANGRNCVMYEALYE